MTLFIPKNLLKLALLAAPDATRYALNGLKVRDLGDGRYRIEVTDGKRMVLVHGPSRAPEHSAAETFAALEGAANSATEVLLAAGDWQTALKLGGRKIDRVGLVMHPEQAVLACGEQTVTVRPLEGRWPDCNTVLPRTRPLFTLDVNPALLAGLCEAATAIGLERARLYFYGPGRPLGLGGVNAEGQAFDALLVPLS